MKSLFSVLITLLFVATFGAVSAYADSSNCQPIYGGGQTCVQSGNVSINKTVARPDNGAFVDNLGVNDPKFNPDQTVTFQLQVTNTGGTHLDKVTAKDVFPQFVSFSAGPGNFDSNSKTLTFELTNLAPNETRTFTVTGKVSNDLPANQMVTCVVNQAMASSGNQTSQDNAQFCVQKPVKEVTTTTTKGGLKVLTPTKPTSTPPTGPEMLVLAGMIPTLAGGLFLRRKAGK